MEAFEFKRHIVIDLLGLRTLVMILLPWTVVVSSIRFDQLSRVRQPQKQNSLGEFLWSRILRETIFALNARFSGIAIYHTAVCLFD
jgi:hypothetical protein